MNDPERGDVPAIVVNKMVQAAGRTREGFADMDSTDVQEGTNVWFYNPFPSWEELYFWGWLVTSMSAFFWWAVLLFDASFLLSQYGPIAACETGVLYSNTGFTVYNQTCNPGNYSPSTIPALMFASISLFLLILWRPTVRIMSGERLYANRFDATHWALFFGIVAYFVENGNDFNPFVTKQRDNIQQNPVPNVNNTIQVPNWRLNSTNSVTQGFSIAFAILAVVVWVLTYLAPFFVRYSNGTGPTSRSLLAWAGTGATLVFIYISLGCNIGPVWNYAVLDANANILSFVSKQCIAAAVALWAFGMFASLVVSYAAGDEWLGLGWIPL